MRPRFYSSDPRGVLVRPRGDLGDGGGVRLPADRGRRQGTATACSLQGDGISGPPSNNSDLVIRCNQIQRTTGRGRKYKHPPLGSLGPKVLAAAGVSARQASAFGLVQTSTFASGKASQAAADRRCWVSARKDAHVKMQRKMLDDITSLR